jgi:hypothetical protein
MARLFCGNSPHRAAQGRQKLCGFYVMEKWTAGRCDEMRLGVVRLLAVNISTETFLLDDMKDWGGTLLVAQWLRHYATNREGAGSIPDGVNGGFH